MTLQPGSKLGPYEILAPLGAGGMGEVYRARDTRLGRDVAVKVLPEHLSSNPELRARFEREARTVSSLNHPSICTLHDIGRERDIDYLVMELVEGGTLAERLLKGPLPTAEALAIGIQVADALERAHRAGIVHRDLKPGNIMLSRGGAKLMDFGLARASGLSPTAGSLTQSPTMTRGLTAEGSIVGTFQYMSPEQLDGGEADARSDVWALGATLYEMLTGQKAFTGRSQASLIASILKEQPRSLAELQPLVPPACEQLIRSCLAKDPDQRIQTAHDVKLQLQWIAEGGSQAGVPAPVSARRRSREQTAWAIAAVALVAAVALGALLVLRRPEPPRVLRFEVTPPVSAVNPFWPRLSPDGRQLAFLASDSAGVTRIWLRPIDALEAHPLPGTEAAGRPFWSPDSRYLAYFVSGKLYKVAAAGGPPTAIGETRDGSDGTWGSAGMIAYDAGRADSLHWISESGGEPHELTHPDRDKGDTNHAWPFFLPDGRHFVFMIAGNSGDGTIAVGEIGSAKVLRLGSSDGRVEYSPPGYLVFPREGSLMAQRFDAGSLKTLGDAVPIAENLIMGSGEGNFDVSPSGLLAFAAGARHELSQLEWFDRNGRSLGVAAPPSQYRDVALSPDGSQIAMSIEDPAKGKEDIWVRQVARGVTSRLTFDPGDEINPAWSPDGQRIAYAADRGGYWRTYFRLASGAGSEDTLGCVAPGISGPTAWSPDGRTMAVRARDSRTGWDVYLCPVAPGSKAVSFVATPTTDQWATFSPDGRWIAYASSQSGRPEVFVQAADGSGGKWQLSTGGGTMPWWRPDGKEVVYQAIDGMLLAVPVSAGVTIVAGTPAELFRPVLASGTYDGRRWTVTADGQRFLVNTPQRGPDRAAFTLTTNWASELRK